MKNLNERIENLINKISNYKVLVIGDLALDVMLYGDTERISREAPVLILQHTHTKYILGGASNAAHNISTINGGKISVIGVAGDDYEAKDLIKAFENANIDCSGIIMDSLRKTTTKTRISGSCSQSITQQIVRIDRQTNATLSKETEKKIITEIEEKLPHYDLVILSDYHIGTITDNIINATIDLANKHSIKVIVDAQKNLDKYKGVYSMTPNLPDTQKHVGFYLKTKDDFINAGIKVINETNAECILITCGDEGMVLIEKDGKYVHIPVFNKSEVFDVTGAGDTVTALYSLSLAAGAKPIEAAIIGNIAAGIVVKQFGCATTNIQQLLDALPKNIELEF